MALTKLAISSERRASHRCRLNSRHRRGSASRRTRGPAAQTLADTTLTVGAALTTRFVSHVNPSSVTTQCMCGWWCRFWPLVCSNISMPGEVPDQPDLGHVGRWVVAARNHIDRRCKSLSPARIGRPHQSVQSCVIDFSGFPMSFVALSLISPHFLPATPPSHSMRQPGSIVESWRMPAALSGMPLMISTLRVLMLASD